MKKITKKNREIVPVFPDLVMRFKRRIEIKSFKNEPKL